MEDQSVSNSLATIQNPPVLRSPRTTYQTDVVNNLGLIFLPKTSSVNCIKEMYGSQKFINDFIENVSNNPTLKHYLTISNNALQNIASAAQQFNHLVNDFPDRMSNFQDYVKVDASQKYPGPKAQLEFFNENLTRVFKDSDSLMERIRTWCNANGWVMHKGKLIRNTRNFWDVGSSESGIPISNSSESVADSVL